MFWVVFVFFILGQLILKIRAGAGRANLAKKTLVDERFLIWGRPLQVVIALDQEHELKQLGNAPQVNLASVHQTVAGFLWPDCAFWLISVETAILKLPHGHSCRAEVIL